MMYKKQQECHSYSSFHSNNNHLQHYRITNKNKYNLHNVADVESTSATTPLKTPQPPLHSITTAKQPPPLLNHCSHHRLESQQNSRNHNSPHSTHNSSPPPITCLVTAATDAVTTSPQSQQITYTLGILSFFEKITGPNLLDVDWLDGWRVRFGILLPVHQCTKLADLVIKFLFNITIYILFGEPALHRQCRVTSSV
jgi:hypothetical protein